MAKESEPNDPSRPADEQEETFRGKWPLPEGARPAKPETCDDAVDEASDKSFPASDPTPFTPTRVG